MHHTVCVHSSYRVVIHLPDDASMTSITFTLEELKHLQALVLQECINQTNDNRNGASVSKEDHLHHTDVLRVVLLHITKALELEKGNQNGNT